MPLERQICACHRTTRIPQLDAFFRDDSLLGVTAEIKTGISAWTDKAVQSARERFEYRYSVEELREWVPKIESLGREAREVHVVMNNCYGNYSVTNARQLAELLGAEDVTATSLSRP